MTISILPEQLRARPRLRPAVAGIMAACVLILAAPGCRTVDTPPPGVPATPFWYMVADTAVWFMPDESLAVVQLQEGISPDSAQSVLYQLRDMGWRLTPERGPALRHGGDYQGLDQSVFQMERVDSAVSPSADWKRFADRFSPGRFSDAPSQFYNILPGLVAAGEDRPEYFWPSCLMLVWSKHTTISDAKAWLDSLRCEIVSSPQISDMYYLKRAWAVKIPPRQQLFEWIRKFERDPRVLQAHPISANSDPPFPDVRLLNKIPSEPDSGIYLKMTPSVQAAYWAAHFAENTVHGARITRIPTEFNRYRLMITTTTMPPYDSALVKRLEGKIVRTNLHRIEAWVPYGKLPDLAADTAVTKIAGATATSSGP